MCKCLRSRPLPRRRRLTRESALVPLDELALIAAAVKGRIRNRSAPWRRSGGNKQTVVSDGQFPACTDTAPSYGPIKRIQRSGRGSDTILRFGDKSRAGLWRSKSSATRRLTAQEKRGHREKQWKGIVMETETDLARNDGNTGEINEPRGAKARWRVRTIQWIGTNIRASWWPSVRRCRSQTAYPGSETKSISHRCAARGSGAGGQQGRSVNFQAKQKDNRCARQILLACNRDEYSPVPCSLNTILSTEHWRRAMPMAESKVKDPIRFEMVWFVVPLPHLHLKETTGVTARRQHADAPVRNCRMPDCPTRCRVVFYPNCRGRQSTSWTLQRLH